MVCNFPAIFIIELERRAVVEKHPHRRLEISETLGINFSYLIVGYTLSHNQPMELLSTGIFLHLQQFTYNSGGYKCATWMQRKLVFQVNVLPEICNQPKKK